MMSLLNTTDKEIALGLSENPSRKQKRLLELKQSLSKDLYDLIFPNKQIGGFGLFNYYDNNPKFRRQVDNLAHYIVYLEDKVGLEVLEQERKLSDFKLSELTPTEVEKVIIEQITDKYLSNRKLCPACFAKLITIDLPNLKHVFCQNGHCQNQICKVGAYQPTFDLAVQELNDKYEQSIAINTPTHNQP